MRLGWCVSLVKTNASPSALLFLDGGPPAPNSKINTPRQSPLYEPGLTCGIDIARASSTVEYHVQWYRIIISIACGRAHLVWACHLIHPIQRSHMDVHGSFLPQCRLACEGRCREELQPARRMISYHIDKTVHGCRAQSWPDEPIRSDARCVSSQPVGQCT